MKKLIIMPLLICNCLAIMIIGGCRSDKVENNMQVIPDLTKIFREYEVDGSIVVYDKTRNKYIVSDTIGINEASLPASTFKILNLLIALETGAIDDEEEVIHFKGNVDTTMYGYRPGTYRDMTVREAFEASAVWVFLELAERIGKDTYKEYIQKINYGNKYWDERNLDFWNYGQLKISPLDQVKFLINLQEEKLPFSKANMAIVKDVMVAEIGSNYIVRGKTGWTSESGTNIGWWVGYIEQDTNVYFFATRLFQDKKSARSDFGISRKRITEQIFEELKLLNQ